MPDTLTAPAPAAPAAPAAPTLPASVPLNPSITPPAVKPSSARARMHERMEAISKDSGEKEKPPQQRQAPPDNTPKRDTPQKPQDKQPTQKPAEEPADNVQDTNEPQDQQDPNADPADQQVQPLDKKKASPWKLVDQFKKRTVALEQELQALKSQVKDPKEVQGMTERLTKAEARALELEQEMRYHDFTKTQEFKTQYQEPYEKAWKSAIDDLNGVTFNDPVTGQERPLSAQDLVDIVGLPLGKARALAEQLYGSFANDVMTHRKAILDLFNKQQGAIEDAKKNGGERLRQRNEQLQKARAAIVGETKEAFEKASQKALEDPKYSRYFKADDTDTEGKTQLERGYKFVDEAFKLNPADPRLSKEERAKIAERHAAVRHRAAAFGRMRSMLTKAEAKVSALTKELDQFKASNPGGGEGRDQRAGEPSQGGARNRLMNELERRSRPA
jgi:hypothetical protein